MITSESIKSLGNGVYSFDYKAKDGTTKTVKFSKETFCYINTTRDEILICANYDQGIDDQFVNDMEDRCDYVFLGVLLQKEKMFGLNDTMLKLDGHWYYDGDTWYINRNNVTLVMNDNAIFAKSPGEFVSDNVGLIKFKGIYGWQEIKEADAKLLKEIL